MEHEQVIEALNRNLWAELSAVEMYAAHADVIREDAVAEGVRAIMRVERRHARDLAARIEALGGTPAVAGGPATVAGRPCPPPDEGERDENVRQARVRTAGRNDHQPSL